MVEETQDNREINTMFKRIRKDEYEESLRSQSSQSDKTELLSQQSQDASQTDVDGTPTSSYTYQPSHASVPTSSAPASSQRSITYIREHSIQRKEIDLRLSYEDSSALPAQLEVANPRLLITCIGILILKHLKSRNYSLAGVFRAIAMQQDGIDPHTVASAWNLAKQGKIHTIDDIPEQHGQSDSGANDLWEAWTTDAEALNLINAPIEAISLTHMRRLLRFSYKLACKLRAELDLNPNFNQLVYVMRYLDSIGYLLEPTLRAVALELTGGQSDRVDEAWDAATSVDVAWLRKSRVQLIE